MNTSVQSGDESGTTEGYCDHRGLIELAASDESWKMAVLSRLEAYAEETERREVGEAAAGKDADESATPPAPGSIESLLLGGEAMPGIMNTKKQSLALPPGEMTCMLYDLVEMLDGGRIKT